MSIQHADITDPYIHEPKDISLASANQVYVADGTGSGIWSVLGADSIDIAEVISEVQSDLNDGTLEVTGIGHVSGVIQDISQAGDFVILPVPVNCTVIRATMVLGGEITVADAEVNLYNPSGSTMGSPVTVPFDGSAKGDLFSYTATGNNELTGPSYIEVRTNGASTDTQPLYVTVEYEYLIN